jgi:phosphinothricin acetyltransferase
MEALIERAAQADLHVMIGAIDSTNVGSIRFHERLGFVEVGRLLEAARKFDRWCELVLLQLTLPATPSGDVCLSLPNAPG